MLDTAQPLKILLVTPSFSAPSVNPWLLDDLAATLARSGHHLDVIVHSATTGRARGRNASPEAGINVWSVGARTVPSTRFRKFLSYLTSGIRLHTSGWRIAKRSTYDLCIYTSIAAFSYGFPGRLRRRGVARSLVFVLWDFFPVHQLDIGRIKPRSLSGPLKWLERLAIRDSDVIAVMSPANERFLRSYHPGLRAKVVLVPPWASSSEALEMPKENREREPFTVIFGGQLAKGRGVDTLLLAAAHLAEHGTHINLIIAGDGPERARLEQLAAEHSLANVTFTGMLAREEYRHVLRTVDAGIAVTVPGVSPPSFPSKIVEYCANALPVIVCLEKSSDAGSYVEERGAGLSVPAGDEIALAHALEQLAAEHKSGDNSRQVAARKLFESELSVENAARRLVESAAVPSTARQGARRNGK